MGSNVTSVMGMMGAGMSVYQDHAAAKEERARAEQAAKEYEAQAALRETEAEEVLKLGVLDRMEHGIKARATRSAQRVDYAYSGVKVDSGSAMETVADQVAWAEYERQRLEYETNLKAWGLNQEAATLRSQAATARSTGISSSASAGKSIFSSASSVIGYLTE